MTSASDCSWRSSARLSAWEVYDASAVMVASSSPVSSLAWSQMMAIAPRAWPA